MPLFITGGDLASVYHMLIVVWVVLGACPALRFRFASVYLMSVRMRRHCLAIVYHMLFVAWVVSVASRRGMLVHGMGFSWVW